MPIRPLLTGLMLMALLSAAAAAPPQATRTEYKIVTASKTGANIRRSPAGSSAACTSAIALSIFSFGSMPAILPEMAAPSLRTKAASVVLPDSMITVVRSANSP